MTCLYMPYKYHWWHSMYIRAGCMDELRFSHARHGWAGQDICGGPACRCRTRYLQDTPKKKKPPCQGSSLFRHHCYRLRHRCERFHSRNPPVAGAEACLNSQSHKHRSLQQKREHSRRQSSHLFPTLNIHQTLRGSTTSRIAIFLFGEDECAKCT